jgi:hypothetical protein
MMDGATRRSAAANATPATPPIAASSTLSPTSCRTSRARAGAERGAQRHLGCPADATREQQVGDIGACHQQHQGDDTNQHLCRHLEIASDQCLVERFDRDAPALVRLRSDARDAAGDRRHIRTRLVDGHRGAQPADDLQVMHLTLFGGSLWPEQHPEIAREQI